MTGKHISPRQTWRENLTLRVQQHNVKLGYYNIYKVLHRNPFFLEKENIYHISIQTDLKKKSLQQQRRIQTSGVQRQNGWIWCLIKFQLVKYNPQT